jgi:hypothetical protein
MKSSVLITAKPNTENSRKFPAIKKLPELLALHISLTALSLLA